MQDNARKITFGAMMIALFVILITVTLYIPLIQLVTFFLSPLPIILCSLQFDRKSSVLVTMAGVFLSMFTGGPLLLAVAVIPAIVGLIIGETVKLGKTKLYVLMATAISLLITLMSMYVIAVFMFNINYVDKISVVFQDIQNSMSTLLRTNDELRLSFDAFSDSFIEFYQHSLPSNFIIFVFIITFIMLTVNFGVLRLLGKKVPKFPPFRKMKLPVITVILYGVILIAQFMVTMDIGSTAYLMSLNATIILRTLFLVQGISLIFFFMHKMKLPVVVSVVASLFALLLSPITTLLGILDTGMNIRAWIGKDKSM